jgi:uncharacterized protein YlxW (UPF0749 family)
MANIREDMQRWLDAYKQGAVINVDNAVIATAFAEFLRASTTKEVENIKDANFELSKKLESTLSELNECKQLVEALKERIRTIENDNNHLNGAIEAYRFCIRCNGVSGDGVN